MNFARKLLKVVAVVGVLVASSGLLPLTPVGITAYAAEACAGTDLLAELATLDPALHEQVMRSADAVENSNAVFWKIEREGVSPSYLLGTMHLTDPRITTLSAKVAEILKSARSVILETVDASPEASAAALIEASKTAVYDNGQSLDKKLSEKEFAKARSALDQAGIPTAIAHLFRPWLVTMLISASDCERKNLKRGRPILDMKIAAEAKARGTPVIGIERIEEQLQAMAALSEDEQLGMLRTTLAFSDRTEDIAETLIHLYASRRLGAIWPLEIALAAKIGVDEKAFSGFREKIILARNIRMRDRALSELEAGGAFMAVGALHLSGKAGLVELLREKGFNVTAIE